MEPKVGQALFATAQLTAADTRWKQECTPSTPHVSSHRVHVESGHRDTQAEDDMDPAGA